MSRPLLLDLFCGAGGAAMGYYEAGFDVVGVDIKPQPHYPFEFWQEDALHVLRIPWVERGLSRFHAVHASPPCQAYSALKVKTTKEWPDLIAPTRTLLRATGLPWVIENVMPAPLHHGITLCGEMFGLRTIRHRRFETSFLIFQPGHPAHTAPTSTKKRRKDFAAGMHISVTGDVGSWVGPACMGIDWMTGNELSEAIPPAYTRFIGEQLLEHISSPAPNTTEDR
jgi:DNA (cytosine-5)-methyltransferase 1